MSTPQALVVMAPAISGAVDARGVSLGTRIPQRLVGTTGASAANSTALERGSYATLQVTDAAAVRYRCSAASSTAVTTDVFIPAGGKADWFVDDNSRFVAIIASDGASTCEASVWTSSDKGV